MPVGIPAELRRLHEGWISSSSVIGAGGKWAHHSGANGPSLRDQRRWLLNESHVLSRDVSLIVVSLNSTHLRGGVGLEGCGKFSTMLARFWNKAPNRHEIAC